MALFAKALPDDAAIEAVADYVATLRVALPRGTTVGNAVRGEQLYATCRACHGATAEGMSALHAPGLNRLDDWYLIRQLEQFQAGSRGYDRGDVFGQQMRGAAALLSGPEDLRDIAAYIDSLAKTGKETIAR